MSHVPWHRNNVASIANMQSLPISPLITPLETRSAHDLACTCVSREPWGRRRHDGSWVDEGGQLQSISDVIPPEER